jgi:hypothetical protein
VPGRHFVADQVSAARQLRVHSCPHSRLPSIQESAVELAIHAELPSNFQPVARKLHYHTAYLVCERDETHVKTDFPGHSGQGSLRQTHPLSPQPGPASRLPVLRARQHCKTRSAKKTDRRNPAMPNLSLMVSLARRFAALT